MMCDDVTILCRDGYRLRGHVWRAGTRADHGTVIINPATGVLARYYHYYARFLVEQGFDVFTYDYRGIGASRPERLRGTGFRWRDWGELDFAAVVERASAHDPQGRLMVVGHSIGGFLPGWAANAARVDRILTVGAQYAYWRDYAAGRRPWLFAKWHVAMPVITRLCGYFPGRRLGWLEDLPAGVANEWSFQRARLEDSHPPHERDAIRARFATVRAPILAVGVTDDKYATPWAIRRGLSYYRGSERHQVMLTPADLGCDAVGHFSLFHARHRDSFWGTTVRWLRDGRLPWPHAETLAAEPALPRLCA